MEVDDKKEDNGASWAEFGLWTISVFMLFSSMIYGISYDNDEKSFSRLAIGIIAFGFAAVIREIRKSKK